MAEEQPSPDGNPDQQDKPQRVRQVGPTSWVLGVLLVLTLLLFVQSLGRDVKEVSFSFFHQQVVSDNVVEIEVEGNRAKGQFKTRPLIPADADSEDKEADADESKSDKKAADEQPGSDAGSDNTPPADDEPEAGDSKEPGDASEKPEAADSKTEDPKTDSAKKDDEKAAAERYPLKFEVNLPTGMQGGIDSDLRNTLLEHNVRVSFREPLNWGGLLTFIWFLLLIGLALMMFSFFRRTRDQMMGGGMLGGVVKSPARRYEAEDGPQITFDDVAGLKNVKRDLKEIVDFLRDPEKFQRLGARVPKGVLLNGPPGTGKTLLAKAVAGEAGVPFFSINGSEFIQLFVGVGASRVRDMFKNAKKSAPSILFIDEIDAVGRQRGAGLGGGHDEREQTLNQILSEMDGFTPSESVIVIAATNRPDVLDPALLRPGRFDRHVTVDRPTIEGRGQLFEVHTRSVPIAEDVDFAKLARGTTGLTGADIANLVNEAALWATRHERYFVTMEDFEYARDKVLMGATREEVLNEEERQSTAYHESGHTLVAWLLPNCDRVHKVTIVPRGRALGVTQLVPDEDRLSMSQTEMKAQLSMMLGGRAAEKLVYNELSSGASNDLERATKLARRMVTHWGMSERLGPVALHNGGDDPFLGREIVQDQRHFSEHTAQIIDDEVSKILHAADDRARRLLTENRDKLDAITNALLEREEIDEEEIEKLIGPAAQDAPPATAVDAPGVAEAPAAAQRNDSP